ncbi:glycosyl transferase [Decorospora gaudefroyi]|uniref:Glycosyl transferase n=1 Tax=Decorospora gaudefroyi TaxID=184978 RepID=A0A6A5KQ48_9PLEO|nr:glycosyl transferase [Decorospora gaudefroyi]
MRLFHPRPQRNALRTLFRTIRSHWKIVLCIILLMVLEAWVHSRSYTITPPAIPLDQPFYTGCQTPPRNTSARANAVLVMLARNSEVEGAVASVKSVQKQFNDAFGYPWVFLNDKAWSEKFKEKFEVIPKEMWTYPSWIDQNRAQQSMHDMQNRHIQYGGKESYHHMCRFQSGFFFDHPALTPYQYYWRVEPNIRFTCAITYDPFHEMAHHAKKYAYTIALWERGATVPSLFRKLSDYKASHQLPTSPLWTAMLDPSWMPWPLRRALSVLPNRDSGGDLWNMCHFWSNFEIADLGFFRSVAYRDLFAFLDRDGGFYYERWGDAAVHSLAAAMLLQPHEIHRFADWGYVHDGLQVCPEKGGEGEEEEGGCRCECKKGARVVEPVSRILSRKRRALSSVISHS